MFKFCSPSTPAQCCERLTALLTGKKPTFRGVVTSNEFNLTRIERWGNFSRVRLRGVLTPLENGGTEVVVRWRPAISTYVTVMIFSCLILCTTYFFMPSNVPRKEAFHWGLVGATVFVALIGMLIDQERCRFILQRELQGPPYRIISV
jgi:hypothetical protein